MGIYDGAFNVSQTVGNWALANGAIVAGTPGFGSGPIYFFDGGGHNGWIYYSFGSVPGGSGGSSTPTGQSPLETHYNLYGHTIPLSVFGVGRIGGEIISGPWVENGLASFIISYGVPADPSGTRDIREIAFDSEVVWTTNGATGVTTSAGGTFSVEAFTFRFYQGTMTQGADTLETTHFGADAVAYRPQMLLAFDNLPIASTKFKKIPYVAAVIGDGSGDDVNLGEAFERLAYSPWVGYTSAQFETTGITDGLVSGGMIIAQEADFLSTIQNFGRFYRSWDILQTDKLRIVDRGSDLTADINLTLERMSGQVVLARAEPNTVPRELILSTIDPEADYTVSISKAAFPRDPVAVSSSIATETDYLPIIMDSSTRMAIVTFAKYQEEVARKRITGTSMIYGLEIEPGALVTISGLGDGFASETFRVIETLHGTNYSIEFTAEAICKCDSSDPYISHVVLLMGFEGADGSQTAPGFTDESPRHHGDAGVANAAQIDTAQFKYGTSSLLLTSTNPKCEFGASTDWRLSAANSDQFTIEAFVRINTLPSALTYAAICSWSLIGVDWDFSILSTGEFRFRYVDTGSNVITVSSSGAGLTTGNWYNLVVDKDITGKIRLFKNGVMVGSSTPANSAFLDEVTFHLLVGSAGVFGAASLDGWIDEIRITKGISRYGSDAGFTPPTDAFPRTA